MMDTYIHIYLHVTTHTHTEKCIYTTAQIETTWNLWWWSVMDVYTRPLKFCLLNFILFTQLKWLKFSVKTLTFFLLIIQKFLSFKSNIYFISVLWPNDHFSNMPFYFCRVFNIIDYIAPIFLLHPKDSLCSDIDIINNLLKNVFS